MPSRPYFAGELREASVLLDLASVLLDLAAALESGDDSDEELAEKAAKPLHRFFLVACGASAFACWSGFEGNQEQCSAHAAVRKAMEIVGWSRPQKSSCLRQQGVMMKRIRAALVSEALLWRDAVWPSNAGPHCASLCSPGRGRAHRGRVTSSIGARSPPLASSPSSLFAARLVARLVASSLASSPPSPLASPSRFLASSPRHLVASSLAWVPRRLIVASHARR